MIDNGNKQLPPGENLRQEATDEFWPALRGELAAPLGHETNNFLNTVLLEVAILEPKVSDAARAELAAIRKHAARLTRLVKQFQDLWRPEEARFCPADVNSVVRQAVIDWCSLMMPSASVHRGSADPAIEVDVTPDLPLIWTLPGDLRRLLLIAFRYASRQSARPGVITARTRLAGKCVRISIDVSSDAPAGEEKDQRTSGLQDELCLEIAACKSIAVRLEGRIISGGASPEGRTDLGIELPVAPPQRVERHY